MLLLPCVVPICTKKVSPSAGGVRLLHDRCAETTSTTGQRFLKTGQEFLSGSSDAVRRNACWKPLQLRASDVLASTAGFIVCRHRWPGRAAHASHHPVPHCGAPDDVLLRWNSAFAAAAGVVGMAEQDAEAAGSAASSLFGVAESDSGGTTLNSDHKERGNPSVEPKSRSCTGCLFYSNVMRDSGRNPICIGVSRAESQGLVPVPGAVEWPCLLDG